MAVFNGPQVTIRLVQDIAEMDWKNIHISYIDVLNLPENRKKDLRESYYFECDCERCADKKTYENMKAAACPKEGCDAAIFVDEHFQCPKCDTAIPEDFKQLFRDVTEATISALDEMRDTSCEYLSYFWKY